MNAFRVKSRGQLCDDKCVEGTFIHADSTAYAQRLADDWMLVAWIDDDALDAIANWWAESPAFMLALLGLALILQEDGDASL